MLVPCASCSRHVRGDVCPFCGTPQRGVHNVAALRRGCRAALLLFGTACSHHPCLPASAGGPHPHDGGAGRGRRRGDGARSHRDLRHAAAARRAVSVAVSSVWWASCRAAQTHSARCVERRWRKLRRASQIRVRGLFFGLPRLVVRFLQLTNMKAQGLWRDRQIGKDIAVLLEDLLESRRPPQRAGGSVVGLLLGRRSDHLGQPGLALRNRGLRPLRCAAETVVAHPSNLTQEPTIRTSSS